MVYWQQGIPPTSAPPKRPHAWTSSPPAVITTVDLQFNKLK